MDTRGSIQRSAARRLAVLHVVESFAGGVLTRVLYSPRGYACLEAHVGPLGRGAFLAVERIAGLPVVL